MDGILLSGWESILQLVTVFIIFIFVLIVTYVTTRWIGNFQKTQLSGGNIQVIETYKVTNNKFLQIVKIGDKYIAIAICKDSITMLTEVDKDAIIVSEIKDSLNVNESFKDLLEKAKQILPKK
ncbi:MAG: flagellar biosynthetic protein FliO [Lachnospiraceae bacterium]|nr:flagellar biosynthetic protein FliO [Lachnospiraceae bacterium]